MEINGYNVVLKVNEKLIAGTTANTFNINPKVKDSLTKEDKGTTRKVVTGYDSEFSVEGIMELNTEEQKATRLDRDEVIDLTLAGEPIPFVYGDIETGRTKYTGELIVTSYSESTNADGEATYSINCAVITKLTKETNE
jgi:predicted secreted protein